MFVLAFVGLFTFMMPKQAKADMSWPRSVWICCPDGNCHLCLCESQSDIAIYRQLLCGAIAEQEK